MKVLPLICLVALLGGALPARAKVRTEVVEYRHGDLLLEGYLALPSEESPLPCPGVLVVHDWRGVSGNTRMRAEQLAAEGFVAFAIDMYGKGVRPTTPEACRKEAVVFYADRELMRARANAGLDVLRARKEVDPEKIAAIGYCFGGATALELSRSGAPLAGTVSFHGNLDTPDSSLAKRIKGKVLVLHGADDPFVPPADVARFQEEMRAAGVDYQINQYGGAVHSFTVVEAGNDPSTGAAYNREADRRSWAAMRQFFVEVLGK